MKIRKGLNGGQYKPLSDEDVEKIHKTSLKIFSEVGVQVNFPEALDLFKEAGASINDSSKIAKFDPELVMELLKPAPSVVHLCGREDSGELDCEIGGNKVYMGTGGTALNVQEPGERTARRSRLEDIKNMARMVDALDNIHFY
ncbi:MAG: trimethylamine methyltransferase family protein, partial [Deltaproteobacteria bacterium]|nr:trimethylamine methyltransferase family protein [Deltaproteobacteria bacterium]